MKYLLSNRNLIYFGFIALIFYRILISFSFDFELINGESNNVWSVLNSHDSLVGLYPDPEKLPFVLYTYTPISQYPLIILRNLVDVDSLYGVYIITAIGRFLQIIYLILFCYYIYRISNIFFHLEKNNSLLLSLLVFSVQLPTSMVVRPDALLYLFNLLSIYHLIVYIDSKVQKNLYYSSLFLVLAFFSKQDGIFLFFPTCLLLFYFERFSTTLKYCIFTLLLIFLFLSIFYTLHGEFFLKNIFFGVKNKYDFSQSISVIKRYSNFFILNLILGLALSILYIIKNKNVIIKIISFYTLFYFCLAFILSLKMGAWINYYSQFTTLSIILSVYFLSSIIKKMNILLVLSFLYALVLNYNFLYHYTLPWIKNLQTKKTTYIKLHEDYIQINKKFHVSKHDNVIANQPLLRNFFYKNSILINTEFYQFISTFNYEPFRKEKDKDISLIITPIDDTLVYHKQFNFFNIDRKNYQGEIFRNYFIYKKLNR